MPVLNVVRTLVFGVKWELTDALKGTANAEKDVVGCIREARDERPYAKPDPPDDIYAFVAIHVS